MWWAPRNGPAKVFDNILAEGKTIGGTCFGGPVPWRGALWITALGGLPKHAPPIQLKCSGFCSQAGFPPGKWDRN